MILVDTNVLIEILKGKQKTITHMENLEEAPALSSVSLMELYYGAFNKTEIKQIDKFTSLFELIPISKAVSFKATELVRNYSKSHNLDIPDSLIAATALVNHCKLLTYNVKDFRYIRGLELEKL